MIMSAFRKVNPKFCALFLVKCVARTHFSAEFLDTLTLMLRKRKDKTKQPETSVEAPPANPVTRDQIAMCAYYIWEAEGRPEGRAVKHWLQAELQLWADRAFDSQTGTDK